MFLSRLSTYCRLAVHYSRGLSGWFSKHSVIVRRAKTRMKEEEEEAHGLRMTLERCIMNLGTGIH